MGIWSDAYGRLQTQSPRQIADLLATLAAFGRAASICGGRLTKTSTNLTFPRVTGIYAPINGLLEEIPASAPTLSSTGLAATTLYNIYIFMSSGVMTMMRSTVAYTLDPTWGYPVMAGDNSRTFIGMAESDTGSLWVDTASNRGVAPWFNRLPRTIFHNSTASFTTSLTSLNELSTAMRARMTVFADETVDLSGDAVLTLDDANATVAFAIGFDSTAPANATIQGSFQAYQNGAAGMMSVRRAVSLTEGAHFMTALAVVGSTANVATFLSGRTALHAVLHGGGY